MAAEFKIFDAMVRLIFDDLLNVLSSLLSPTAAQCTVLINVL